MPSPDALVSDRYRLHQLLGEGGMGEVWSATDEVLRRPVAIKLLKQRGRPDLGDPERMAEERRRLLREARAAYAVRHPGVVEILDVVDGGEVPILVMELLHGVSLRHRLERGGKLDLRTACELFGQVAAAVGAVHEHGIIHRDLKPENIFLQESAGALRVKVLDFGIAKVLHRQGSAETNETNDLTRTGQQMGSPAYMSPEQSFGEKDIDHRTDIWSLGIVLYECLSGVLPTRAANTGQVLKIITKLGVPPIESVLPEVPGDIAQLLRRMLAERPADRPADLGEVAAILGRHSGAAVAAAPQPKKQRLGALLGQVAAKLPGRDRLSRAMAPALLGLFIASVGAGAALWKKDAAGTAEDVRTAPLSSQPLRSQSSASPAPSGGDSILPAGAEPQVPRPLPSETTAVNAAPAPAALQAKPKAQGAVQGQMAAPVAPPAAEPVTMNAGAAAGTPPEPATSPEPVAPSSPPPVVIKSHSLDANPFRQSQIVAVAAPRVTPVRSPVDGIVPREKEIVPTRFDKDSVGPREGRASPHAVERQSVQRAAPGPNARDVNR